MVLFKCCTGDAVDAGRRYRRAMWGAFGGGAPGMYRTSASVVVGGRRW